MDDKKSKSRRARGETQERILAFIKEQIFSKGYPPSVREIGEAVGLNSTSTVHGHLKRLAAKGLLIRDAMKPRAIGVMDMDNQADDLIPVPVLGPVAAGYPILAEEQPNETLTLPASMLGKGEHFALVIRGDSMVNAGILNGDTVIVRRQATANNGEIIVAMVQGDATCKRFYKENGHFRLQPENSSMQPIYTPFIEILGKVTSVIRMIK